MLPKMVSKFQGVPDLPRDGGGVNNRPCARTTALPLLPPPGLKGRPTVANKGDPANQRAGIFSKANQRKSFGPAR